MADSTKITSLPVWVRFSWLPVEYYTEEWLWKAGNTIGQTIKIDNTTLATSRGRFAQICVEIKLDKPLVVSYKIRGREGQFHYEGLHDLCFLCGKYGHREAQCPVAMTNKHTEKEQNRKTEVAGEGGNREKPPEQKGAYGS